MELSGREGTGGWVLQWKEELGPSRAHGNRRVLAVLCVCRGSAEAGVARGVSIPALGRQIMKGLMLQ